MNGILRMGLAAVCILVPGGLAGCAFTTEQPFDVSVWNTSDAAWTGTLSIWDDHGGLRWSQDVAAGPASRSQHWGIPELRGTFTFKVESGNWTELAHQSSGRGTYGWQVMVSPGGKVCISFHLDDVDSGVCPDRNPSTPL